MKIKKMTDEQALAAFSELLATRVRLGTAYVSDPETGVLTHQLILITCGDLRVQSAPEPLVVPLMPVVPKEATVN
jgi:hypothetical protein